MKRGLRFSVTLVLAAVVGFVSVSATARAETWRDYYLQGIDNMSKGTGATAADAPSWYRKAIDDFTNAVKTVPPSISKQEGADIYYQRMSAYFYLASLLPDGLEKMELMTKSAEDTLMVTTLDPSVHKKYLRPDEKYDERFNSVDEMKKIVAIANCQLGAAYEQAGDKAAAEKCKKRVVELVKMDCEKLGEELGADEIAAKTPQEQAKEWGKLGNTYENEANYEEAIACYKKSIKADPTYVLSYLWLSESYTKLSSYEDAITICTKGLELGEGPKSKPPYYFESIFHVERGNAYRELGRYDEALDDLSTAIRLSGEWDSGAGQWSIYYDRGRTYEKMGKVEEAKKDYKAACDLGNKDACAAYDRLNK